MRHFDLPAEPLRIVTVPGDHTLAIWETDRPDSRRNGRNLLGYAFWPAGTDPLDDLPLFAGADFGSSPCHAEDSDDSLWCLLGFLAVRPGDTDSEYFTDYTPEQQAWTRSGDCEQLSCDACEPDPDDSEAITYRTLADMPEGRADALWAALRAALAYPPEDDARMPDPSWLRD